MKNRRIVAATIVVVLTATTALWLLRTHSPRTSDIPVEIGQAQQEILRSAQNDKDIAGRVPSRDRKSTRLNSSHER